MSEPFGCVACWPENADDAWAARGKLTPEADLIDESHFHVALLRCARCSQVFVSIFAETIDWVDGEDPQYWTLLPLTADESTSLRTRNPLREADLDALGAHRRSLRRSFPKEVAPFCVWSTGLIVGPHD